MTNVYADLATLKSPAVLNVPDDAHDDRLLGMLEAASRWIDGYCGRQFGAFHGERRFDGTGRASLTAPDLIAVSEVRVREASGEWVAWSSSDWLLYPLNAAPTTPGGRPYTRIMLASGARRRFPLNRAGVAVTGVWGYGDVREETGLTVGGDAALTAVAGTLTVSAPVDGAAALSAGNTIRVGDEQLYIAVVSTDTQGATTLAVRRGVNGTEASAHIVGSAISRYRYPEAVAEACLQQAALWWRERFGGPFRPPEADGRGEAAGVSPTVRTLLAPYRRRSAALGV